ncbi:MAG: glycosyltransferase family 4 protein [Actinobacteria bacterium]|nr:glycosyltransferase family 4 protein [Actinomycetota bacterium]
MTEPVQINRTGKIALVPARYGPGLVGGAEIVMAEMAEGLAARGWDVEIITTCALDHFTWRNELPAGFAVESGMPVRRFPVMNENLHERAELEAQILRGNRLTIQQQQRWINGGMRSPELYHHILDHADEYRALIFTPYPFWVTFAGSQVAPERSVLWTCLHDEPYAYLDVFDPVFSGVAGLLFQSGPEHDLAHRIQPRLAPHAVVGCGVGVPVKYDPDGFRERYGIEGRFLLYAGRREGAKGWEQLLDAFEAANAAVELPFSLVTMGRGPVKPPAAIADRVVDLGFLPDVDRDNAFAAADAYLQPSRYEAFSRTIMEAWLAGTPVIANRASDVVAWHCERSGAGLTYDDTYEFEQCLDFLAGNSETASEMAASGRQYVLDNYQWPDVLDRVEARLSEWTR